MKVGPSIIVNWAILGTLTFAAYFKNERKYSCVIPTSLYILPDMFRPPRVVTSGVSQNVLLGPLLFVVHTNDLVHNLAPGAPLGFSPTIACLHKAQPIRIITNEILLYI